MSATLRLAVKFPTAAGVKTIEIEQLSPAASVVPQVLVSAKSPAFVPVMVMPLMLSAALPGFEREIVCAAAAVFTAVLGKEMLPVMSRPADSVGTPGPLPQPASGSKASTKMQRMDKRLNIHSPSTTPWCSDNSLAHGSRLRPGLNSRPVLQTIEHDLALVNLLNYLRHGCRVSWREGQAVWNPRDGRVRTEP